MRSEPPRFSPSLQERREALDVRALPVTSTLLTAEWHQARGLTVIVPILPDRVEALRDTLLQVDLEVRVGKGDRRNPLAALDGLHFLRWVILPERVRERGIRVTPSLVLWTVFDEGRDEHLTKLVQHARALLDRVYARHCGRWPAKDAPATEIVNFLLAHETDGQVAPYVGTPGVTVPMIEKQDELAKKLSTFVREAKRDDPTTPNTHVFVAAQRFVDGDEFARDNPELAEFARRAPAAPPQPRSLQGAAIRALLGIVGVGVLIGLTLGATYQALYVGAIMGLVAVAAGIAAAWAVVLLLWLEPRDAERWIPESSRFFDEWDGTLRARDNEAPGINRMTIVTDVKAGFVRWATMRAVLWLIRFRASRSFEGRLQGVETIHFANWRLIDSGRRLLFMSNFDGSASRYLADFSVNATPGVNAIWSNTEGFPPTTALVGEGARDVEAFQNAARVHQIVTDAWYCGYSDRRMSTRQINDNWRVHRMLRGFPTPAEVDAWVAILEGRA